MSTLNSALVLERLALLRRVYVVQDLTFTSEQSAQWAALRRARWARVAEISSVA